jgi:hypothetical protein
MPLSVGEQFNDWTVKEQIPNHSKHGEMYRCVCRCGSSSIVRRSKLVDGLSKSCRSCGRIRQSEKVKRHGLTDTPTWKSWSAMMNRASGGSNDHEKRRRYFNRGRIVVPPLDIFESFLEHMGERPPGTTLDRKDNDLPYQIGNLRWATSKEQCRNRSTNRILEYNGESLTAVEWGERLGLTPETIAARINRGYTPDQIFSSTKFKGGPGRFAKS